MAYQRYGFTDPAGVGHSHYTSMTGAKFVLWQQRENGSWSSVSLHRTQNAALRAGGRLSGAGAIAVLAIKVMEQVSA